MSINDDWIDADAEDNEDNDNNDNVEDNNEAKCCFCGDECNPNSQACGPCRRNGPTIYEE